ncbi:hypothetical protein FB446DRAFT_760828, partial [Lentinula raphanica]
CSVSSNNSTRCYDISLTPGRVLIGKQYPRTFHGKKLFQYNWYPRILNTTDRSPLIFLHRDDFSANRLKKLRRDIQVASQKYSKKAEETGQVIETPMLTVVWSSVFGAALREYTLIVPPRPEKTAEEIAKEIAEKSADPAQPGRRMKHQRAVLVPDLKVMGALLEGKVLLPARMQELSKFPPLDTLRAQIVGLLTVPSAQLAAVMSQASGGQLA